MIEYLYRGFKLSYVVTQQDGDRQHKADGYATYLLSEPKSFTATQLQVAGDSHEDAEHEIKSMLEGYVNTQLQAFYTSDAEAVGQM